MTKVADLEGAYVREDGVLGISISGTYATDASDLWAALTRPERLARWIGVVSGDLHAGGRYSADLPATEEHVTGTIIACEPDRRIELSWSSDGGRTSSTVRATLKRLGPSATRLELRELGIDETDAPIFGAGWQSHAERLDAEARAAAIPDWAERWQALIPAYRARFADWILRAGDE